MTEKLLRTNGLGLAERLRTYAAPAAGLWLAAALGTVLLQATAGVHRLTELFSHFRPQCLLACAVSCPLLLLPRRHRKKLLAAGALLLLAQGWPLAHYYLPSPAPAAGVARLKLVQFNVYTANPAKRRAVEWLRAEQPDLIALEEVDSAWATELAELAPDYPYSVIEPREDNFGIALLSRLPLERARVVRPGGSAEIGPLPSIVAELAPGGRRLRLAVTHPLPPLEEACRAHQHAQLAALAELLRREGDAPLLLAGDLNATMWSPAYADLAAALGLENARAGSGLLPTWPTRLPGLLRLPLDHVLCGREFAVAECRAGPYLGSDHLPLVVVVTIMPRE